MKLRRPRHSDFPASCLMSLVCAAIAFLLIAPWPGMQWGIAIAVFFVALILAALRKGAK